MIFNLFSDPHLGTRRSAHTTRDSSRRLQNMLYTQALVASEPTNSICLGDLFDRAANDEATLVQGYKVADRCLLTLAGNHDLTNRAGVVTTLDALHSVLDGRVVISSNISEPYFEVHGAPTFWVVPHHASQTLFDEALRAAAQSAKKQAPNGHRYLLLHCNYDVPFDTEDSTLNLSPEMAEHLLKSFTRIFIGHEHNSKQLCEGRLVIVGNVMATSFSDISDKYRWELDTREDRLTAVKIWDKSTNYREIEYGSPLPDLDGVQFVDVVGAEPVDNGVEVADYVRSIWDAGGPMLLAVRNNVEIIDHLAGDSVDTSKPALVDLKQRIGDDLEGSDLQPLYRRLLSTAESE